MGKCSSTISSDDAVHEFLIPLHVFHMEAVRVTREKITPAWAYIFRFRDDATVLQQGISHSIQIIHNQRTLQRPDRVYDIRYPSDEAEVANGDNLQALLRHRKPQIRLLSCEVY